jgi:hypothetical protein
MFDVAVKSSEVAVDGLPGVSVTDWFVAVPLQSAVA